MIAIAVLAVAFIAGILVGIIVLLRIGIAREESRRSLRSDPGTGSIAATRRVLGLYVRMPANVTQDVHTYDLRMATPLPRARAVPQRQALRELATGRPNRADSRDGLR
jgi:hypothetical protein